MEQKNEIDVTTVKGRAVLSPRKDPYYRRLHNGLAVGLYVAKDGTQSWWVRARVDRKYIVKALPNAFDYKSAVNAAADEYKAHEDGTGQTAAQRAEDAAQDMTVAKLIESYIGLKKHESKGDRFHTWYRDATRFSNRYVIPYIGQRRIRSLTAEDIDALYAQLVTEVSPETVIRSTVTLRSALNYALTKGWISKAFWREATLPKERPAHRKTRMKEYISRPDRDAFLERLPVPVWQICKALDITGARPSELRRARVADVALERNPVLHLETFKGGGSSRQFPLNGGRLAFFKELTEGRDPDEYLFLTAEGLPWSMANLSKHIKAHRGDLPLEAYSFRHCFITDQVAVGTPLLAIAKAAGTSVAHIQKNYTTGLDVELPEL